MPQPRAVADWGEEMGGALPKLLRCGGKARYARRGGGMMLLGSGGVVALVVGGWGALWAVANQ